jgi:hypothetical protein
MIVLAIVSVLMLATTSTRAEGDRELGVRIIAAAMFKIALVFIVVQNAVLLSTPSQTSPRRSPTPRTTSMSGPEPPARRWATLCGRTSRNRALLRRSRSSFSCCCRGWSR